MKKHIIFLLTLMVGVLAGATANQFPDSALLIQDVNITPFLVTGGSLLGSFVQLTPAGVLSTYAMVNIPKKKSNAGAPSPKKDTIIAFKWDDVETPPKRDDKGILITETFKLKKGTTSSSIYVTPGTIKVNQKSEGDTDAKATVQQIDVVHPGSSLEIDEFLENNLNENLGLLILPYETALAKKLCGAPEAPLQIESDSTDDKDGDKNNITFKSVVRGPRIAHYQGDIPVASTSEGA